MPFHNSYSTLIMELSWLSPLPHIGVDLHLASYGFMYIRRIIWLNFLVSGLIVEGIVLFFIYGTMLKMKYNSHNTFSNWFWGTAMQLNLQCVCRFFPFAIRSKILLLWLTKNESFYISRYRCIKFRILFWIMIKKR